MCELIELVLLEQTRKKRNLVHKTCPEYLLKQYELHYLHVFARKLAEVELFY
jgi:hypothetical protein